MNPDTTTTRTPIIGAFLTAMIVVSIAGALHKSMGAEWGIVQQIAYAAIGAMAWRRMRPVADARDTEASA